jgi:hypothetical protein
VEVDEMWTTHLRDDALDVAFEGQAASLGFPGEAGFESGWSSRWSILLSG